MNALAGRGGRAHARARPTTSEPLAADLEPARRIRAARLAAGARSPHHGSSVRPLRGRAQDLSLILIDLPDFDSVARRAPRDRRAARRPGRRARLGGRPAEVRRRGHPPRLHRAAGDARIRHDRGAQPGRPARRPARSATSSNRCAGCCAATASTACRCCPSRRPTGTGIDELRRRIARFAAERKAASQRLAADVRGIAARLERCRRPGQGAGADVQALERGLAAAANVDAVVAARSPARTASAPGRSTGWPLTAWMLRLAPDPLRRLHLPIGRERGRDAGAAPHGMPPMSAAQRAQAGTAVRAYADAAATGLGEGWSAAIHEHRGGCARVAAVRARPGGRAHRPRRPRLVVVAAARRAPVARAHRRRDRRRVAAAADPAAAVGHGGARHPAGRGHARPGSTAGRSRSSGLLGGVLLGIVLGLVGALVERRGRRRPSARARRRLRKQVQRRRAARSWCCRSRASASGRASSRSRSRAPPAASAERGHRAFTRRGDLGRPPRAEAIRAAANARDHSP